MASNPLTSPVSSPNATDPTHEHDPSLRRVLARFTRYFATSLITVPVGYTLLVVATHIFDVNAGLLNLAIGTLMTPMIFMLYRSVVWRGGSGRSIWAEFRSFWQTFLAGLLASTIFIAAADAFLGAGGPLIVVAGLTGQGVIFLARFFWLDRVTFARPAPAHAATAAVE